jgi:Fe2+ or Zn2+ uptake regulation protein
MVMAIPSALPPEHPARLREAGLRVTSPRLAVLAALPDHHHLDVETIARTARDRLGSLSTQAVYDILRALTDAGLVRRIEPAGSPALYETRVGDNHHHVVCRSCGSTADVDCAVGERPCLTPSNASGFVLDEAEITFWGLCPACQSTPSTRIAPGRNAS